MLCALWRQTSAETNLTSPRRAELGPDGVRPRVQVAKACSHRRHVQGPLRHMAPNSGPTSPTTEAPRLTHCARAGAGTRPHSRAVTEGGECTGR